MLLAFRTFQSSLGSQAVFEFSLSGILGFVSVIFPLELTVHE